MDSATSSATATKILRIGFLSRPRARTGRCRAWRAGWLSGHLTTKPPDRQASTAASPLTATDSRQSAVRERTWRLPMRSYPYWRSEPARREQRDRVGVLEVLGPASGRAVPAVIAERGISA